jgi:hypothetical protein
VVQDAREVGCRSGEQRSRDAGVEREPDRDRQRLLHRPARQLVAEGHRVLADLEDAEPLGLGDRLQVGTERAQQGRLDPRRDDRELLDDRARGGAQPVHAGQDGVDDGAGHRVVRGRQRLGDEERVARRRPVQALHVDRGARRQLRHGVRREPSQR